MNTILKSISIALTALLLSGPVYNAAAGEGNGRFFAHLKGRNEVPPVDTRAQGQVLLKVDEEGLHYTLIVANIEDVVAAHIHCGEAGVNGPVGVTLFGGSPVSSNGILAQGTIDAPDAGNACGWTDIEDVVSAILNGEAYVNVHTLGNPSGEIRGQLR
jgi:hypothetical protein